MHAVIFLIFLISLIDNNRWEGEGLSGHGKVIFHALDDLVCDIALKIFNQHGHDAKTLLQDIVSYSCMSIFGKLMCELVVHVSNCGLNKFKFVVSYEVARGVRCMVEGVRVE